ncbi:MAG: alpha/beta fold hydrolase [Pseudomonadota bacterium]
MATYVLVHGAWHTGELLEDVARPIRAQGHQVHCPTLAGNRPGDSKKVGLNDAVGSLLGYFDQHRLSDVVLLVHSYGGMVITPAAEALGNRVRRLVYWNAFVPRSGESLNDMVPPHYASLFDQIEKERGDGSVVLPFPIWREAFINDADLALATSAFERLNPHPYKTLTDKISLKQPLAELQIGKSYVNCQQDISLPHSLPWHPRLSERLGLFRLVECPGSHEIWFTDPQTIARAIVAAGRD